VVTVLVRPAAFVLGLLACIGGAITCVIAPAADTQAFPSLSDGLVFGGFALVIVGVAGRNPRGRQMLGPRAAPSSDKSSDKPPARPNAE